MTIQRMEHVGIVVDDVAAATEFFAELGLVLQGEAAVDPLPSGVCIIPTSVRTPSSPTMRSTERASSSS